MAGSREQRSNPTGRRAADWSLRTKLFWARVGYILGGVGILLALVAAAFNYGRIQQQQTDNRDAISKQEDRAFRQDEKIANNCARIARTNDAMVALIAGLTSTPAVSDPEVRTRMKVAQEALEAEPGC